MKALLIVLMLVSLLTAVSACGHAAVDTASKSQESRNTVNKTFVSYVRANVPAFATADDSDLLELGHLSCKYLLAEHPLTGESLYGLVVNLTTGSEGLLTEQGASTFIGASVGAFCPQLAPKINSLAEGNT